MFNISIVVRAFNEALHLPKLFYGIQNQSITPFEIILVDSGSTDKTLEIANQNNCKIFHIEKEKFTFGRSLNLGCFKSSGDIIVICSAHCFPKKKTWLEDMIKPFENENVGMTYGKQRGTKDSNFSENQLFYDVFPSKQPNKLKYFANNANSAIRKSVFNQVKFDEDLTGCEDIDYAKKISAIGYKTIYVPEATIYHLHQETFLQISNRFYREMIALKKIFSDFDVPFYVIIAFFKSLISDFYYLFKENKFQLKFIGEIFKFRTAKMYGILKAKDKIGLFKKPVFEEIYYSNKINYKKSNKKEEDLIYYNHLKNEK